MKKLILFAAIFICQVSASLAQSGSLDNSFENDGIVINQNYTGFCNKVLYQSDGKILAIGEGYNQEGNFFMLFRYNANGTIDESFGENGRTTTSFPNSPTSHLISASLQPDSKILTVGYSYLGGRTGNILSIARYSVDGKLDSTFGTGGKVNTQIKSEEFPCGIGVQTNGKIIVGGFTSKPGEDGEINTIFIIRYNTDGTIDASFGDKGIHQETVIDPISVAGFAIQFDDKILIGGNYTVSNQFAFFVRRYLASGQPDISFGTNGEASFNFEQGATHLSSITISEENILAAGYKSDGSVHIPTIIQFNASGTLNFNFGINGVAMIIPTKSSFDLSDIIVQSDKKILTALRKYDLFFPYDTSYFAIARFLQNGVLDSTYATNGIQVTAIDGYAATHSIALQDDGKSLLAGSSYVASVPAEYFALARYNGDDSERNKYVRIKHWLHHHGITWEDKPNNLINYYSIQSSTNGNAFTEVARIFSNHHGAIQNYSAANNASANYRVAAVSNTGNITYSNTLTLVNNTPTIQLYPNPAKNNLQIQGLPAGTTKLTITDISGNTRIIATANSTVYSINIAQLTSGNYLLHIKTANEIITKQFIKE